MIIAGGGGGIPVYQDVVGDYRGAEAVIDKDYVAAIRAVPAIRDPDTQRHARELAIYATPSVVA